MFEISVPLGRNISRVYAFSAYVLTSSHKVFFSLQVSVPKGSLCNLSVSVNVGLPPDAVYNIVTDPDNKRVFKNIKASNNGLFLDL